MSGLGAVLLVEQPEPPAELESALGAERAGALQAELARLAADWARGLGARSLHTALSGTPLPAQVDSILASVPGSVLVVWPRLLRWRPEHSQGALEDLEAGCQVVFGPMIDDGLYLLGLSRSLPEIVAAVEEGSQPSGPGTSSAWTTAAELGLEIGYLRPERGLRSEADVVAALADPGTPAEIRGILERPSHRNPA